MPVQINELVIRTVISDSSPSAVSNRMPTDSASERKKLQEAVDEMIRILKNKNER